MKQLKEGDIVFNNFYYPIQIGVVKFGWYENNNNDVVQGFFIKWFDNEMLISEADYWVKSMAIKAVGNIYEREEER